MLSFGMRVWVGVLGFVVLSAVSLGSTGCSDCGLKITSNELPNGTVGFEYRFNLQSSCGGDSWFTNDRLPPGISLQSDGDLRGTPTLAGIFLFTVTVVDFGDGEETSKGFQLVVDPATAVRTPTATPGP
jgi:hypothetical protein